MHTTLTAVACLALACAGSAAAQTSTSDTSSMSADHAASSSRHTTKRHASKTTKAHQDNGANAAPSGGLANPKDVSPGTYNSSGGAVPKTSDPMQTKNSRDGTPLSGGAAASGTGK